MISDSDLKHRLRQALGGAILDQLTDALLGYPIDRLTDPVLHLEAFVQGSKHGDVATAHERSPLGKVIVSQPLDLRYDAKSGASLSITPCRVESEQAEEQDDDNDDNDNAATITRQDQGRETHQKRPVSGLRPAKRPAIAVEESDDDSRRQLQITDHYFPKRAKVQSAVVFTRQDSSLSKFIVGVWEQIHSGVEFHPQALVEQLQVTAASSASSRADAEGSHNDGHHGQVLLQPSGLFLPSHAVANTTSHSFSKSNVFCRRVTQASRTCRSVEVIVQARWTEHFDAYVDLLSDANPNMSPTRRRKVALVEACSDFGWSEKELRNKMAIWRGYKEIKDAGGWVALIFAGMGLYRFCKYRIGFDRESMQRLQALRLRWEVAADTLHPQWRQILLVVGEPCQRRFTGHPHDWVVHPDGSAPVPLRSAYIDNDPNFIFEHLGLSVVDKSAWGDSDPRWTLLPDSASHPAGTDVCQSCRQTQMDDPTLNCCYCFPSLFGSIPRPPCAVQVFRTSDGRNNGLQALVPFERGVAIGEFVGVVTRGISGLDVMECSTSVGRYQIWQGRQGNFTRFVNHSCKANAQFQRFAWLGTQRVILVSKGIEAGMEITVDYSTRYWRGLDKKCLCGESCCRYNSAEDH